MIIEATGGQRVGDDLVHRLSVGDHILIAVTLNDVADRSKNPGLFRQLRLHAGTTLTPPVPAI
jgi:hypothetical protein